MGSSQVFKLPNCVSLVQEYRLSRLAAGLVPGPHLLSLARLILSPAVTARGFVPLTGTWVFLEQ
ncbi:unnamed protein product, partial [Vitis vinifera]